MQYLVWRKRNQKTVHREIWFGFEGQVEFLRWLIDRGHEHGFERYEVNDDNDEFFKNVIQYLLKERR